MPTSCPIKSYTHLNLLMMFAEYKVITTPQYHDLYLPIYRIINISYYPVKYNKNIIIIYKFNKVIYISKISYDLIWINNFYLSILNVTIIYNYTLTLDNHLQLH